MDMFEFERAWGRVGFPKICEILFEMDFSFWFKVGIIQEAFD
tara:strand:- start:69 stop:194 length:126 start_codon:yes stop_codon:yes gene_type:complete